LLKLYGTNSQAFIGTVKYRGTARAVVLAQPGQNPFLPGYPGASGLLFASRHEVLQGVHMLFVKLEPESIKETPLWEYRGDFKSVLSAKMTPAEFKMQRDNVNNLLSLADVMQSTHTPKQVKAHWARHILAAIKWPCYTSMRARIFLRRQGCLPLEKEAQATAVNQEVQKICSGRGGSVSPAEVIDALTLGDEVRLNCPFETPVLQITLK
jgi:hypothetical protein